MTTTIVCVCVCVTSVYTGYYFNHAFFINNLLPCTIKLVFHVAYSYSEAWSGAN